MNPTFFHLLFLFTAPLIWFSGNKSARLLVLSAIPLIALINIDLAPFSLAGFIAAISLDHRKSFALSSSSSSRAIVCYTACARFRYGCHPHGCIGRGNCCLVPNGTQLTRVSYMRNSVLSKPCQRAHFGSRWPHA